MKTLYVNSIKQNSFCDGPGIRTVVFLQGCDLHCKGCHNKSTWDVNDGIPVSTAELAAAIRKTCANGKVTISGGEPLMQAEAVEELLAEIADLDVALYTGHRLEDVPAGILDKLKYVKTGEFQLENRTTVTPFVGSTNQVFRRLK